MISFYGIGVGDTSMRLSLLAFALLTASVVVAFVNMLATLLTY